MNATAGGGPSRCLVCGAGLVEDPAGDAPCASCGHLVWFRWTEDQGEIVVHPFGSTLTMIVVERLADLVRTKDHLGLFVLDLAEVECISSSVIARLVELLKGVTARGGRLRIRNLPPNLRDVFHVTRLDQVFHVE